MYINDIRNSNLQRVHISISTSPFLAHMDGFPRTLEQAKALDKLMEVDLVINLDIPTETIVERISDR